jgi:hypothetical protein
VQISSRLLVLADLVEESPRQPESGPARAFTPPRTNKSLFRREPVQGIGWGAFGDPVGAALR